MERDNPQLLVPSFLGLMFVSFFAYRTRAAYNARDALAARGVSGRR